MAIQPNPDRDPTYMQEMWGTTRLITDYMPIVGRTPSEIKKNDPPTDRMSRQCGGKGGFDDYVERWHE